MKRISFNEAKSLVRELVEKKEFPESEAALFQKLLWAFVELGEATDAFKKGRDWDVVTEELMDTIFYIIDFVGLVEKTQQVQLDLDDIFLKKWERNLQRPNHFGLRKDIVYSPAIAPKPPKKLTMEITKKCYNRCVYCSAYVSEEDAQAVLSSKNAKVIIDQYSELGGQELNISGGEPLLHPEWCDIASYAKDKGLKVRLFSCGILSEQQVDEAKLLETIDKILKIGFESVEMTLHAPYSALHEEITEVEGSFKNTYRFIKQISKIGNLEINFVPMQINADELEELVDFVGGLGIKKLNILRFIPQGRGLINKDWLSLKEDQLSRLMRVVLSLSEPGVRRRNDVDVNVGHPGDFTFLLDKSRVPKLCTAGIEQCMVKINGDVVPCPAFGDLKDWVAGNVFKQSLGDIWTNSPIFVSLREFDYKRMQGQCRICESLAKCQGRCPAERIRENGALYKGPDPGCPKNYI